MKKIVFMSLIFLAGCGSGFLGLEDYQRDILSVLIGQSSGSDGLDCWDKSSDGVCDASEDWAGPDGQSDGICDAWDCQGAPGERGRQGRGVKTPEDDCTTLCHCNQDKCHTLTIAAPAVKAHLNHGDVCGACEG